MKGGTTVYGGLLAGQVVGSIVVVVGIFLAGVESVPTIVGGLIILGCVAGLAYLAAST